MRYPLRVDLVQHWFHITAGIEDKRGSFPKVTDGFIDDPNELRRMVRVTIIHTHMACSQGHETQRQPSRFAADRDVCHASIQRKGFPFL